ncbi:TetR/AcrR family transcriptional regulator [Arthrobacter sp. KNU40]|uniref:TetR/AcrR family transcriptional regulator n=1 Tax=Arthrobacter sp. KNU40 TaxID=3447965 RepID=UPI003F62EE68
MLSLASEYILEHGILGLTLTALADGIGSNRRMLLYHFGSFEALCNEAEAAAHARFPKLFLLGELDTRDQPIADRLKFAWRGIADEENVASLKLFFERFGLTLRSTADHAKFLHRVGSEWTDRVDRELGLVFPAVVTRDAAEAIVALWRGLQLALLAGTPKEQLIRANDEAVEALVLRLAASMPDENLS